jgi:hypothetical protein
VFHVLHRRLTPRHPPYALSSFHPRDAEKLIFHVAMRLVKCTGAVGHLPHPAQRLGRPGLPRRRTLRAPAAQASKPKHVVPAPACRATGTSRQNSPAHRQAVSITTTAICRLTTMRFCDPCVEPSCDLFLVKQQPEAATALATEM